MPSECLLAAQRVLIRVLRMAFWEHPSGPPAPLLHRRGREPGSASPAWDGESGLNPALFVIIYQITGRSTTEVFNTENF